MAGLTPKLLYIGSGSASNVYTASTTANAYTIIKNINICNTDTANTVCSIHLLTIGQTAGANNKILSNIAVLGNNVTYYNTAIVMPANSALYLTQSGSNATVAISGVEYTP